MYIYISIMILIYYKSEQFSIESTKRIREQDEDWHKDEQKKRKKRWIHILKIIYYFLKNE